MIPHRSVIISLPFNQLLISSSLLVPQLLKICVCYCGHFANISLFLPSRSSLYPLLINVIIVIIHLYRKNFTFLEPLHTGKKQSNVISPPFLWENSAGLDFGIEDRNRWVNWEVGTGGKIRTSWLFRALGLSDCERRNGTAEHKVGQRTAYPPTHLLYIESLKFFKHITTSLALLVWMSWSMTAPSSRTIYPLPL